MAITQFSLSGSGNDTDAASFTTDVQTPTADRLILAAISSGAGNSASNVEPTLTGNGLTWSTVVSNQFDAAGAAARITLFRALGSSPTSGSVTIDFGGFTQTVCEWSFSEFAGIDTSGSNGENAVVQSAVATGASNSLSITLAAFGSASNATYGAIAIERAQAITAGSGFTQIHETQLSTPAFTTDTQWRDDNDTTVDWSWTTNSVNGGIAVEIKAAAAASAVAAQPVMQPFFMGPI